MEKEFVPYEQALALKELGFDEPCIKGYTEEYKKLISFANTHTNTSVKNTLPTKPFTAPLYQQAFRWFREKYDLCVIIDEHTRPQIKTKGVIGIGSTLLFEYTKNGKYAGFEYEEAELECLKKLIEIVKNK
jgi:hypothetical protein